MLFLNLYFIVVSSPHLFGGEKMGESDTAIAFCNKHIWKNRILADITQIKLAPDSVRTNEIKEKNVENLIRSIKRTPSGWKMCSIMHAFCIISKYK